jgi:Fe-S cluster biogenesis protein NfuA
MSQDQLLHRIQAVLEGMRPALKMDGGDVELVSFDKGIVQVRLQGACSTCPISFYTLKNGIEEQLKKAVPEVQEVVSIA